MLMCSDTKECRGCVKEVALKMLVFLSSSCLITWPSAASIHSRVWTEESCTDDMLSTTGGKAESGLQQADNSAVGCCSPYASLCPSLFFPPTYIILAAPFLFLPLLFDICPPPPSSLFTTLYEHMLVWSISCLACLGHFCNAAFICFTESRPQQWALTGLSIMLGPVIDLIRATRELENRHTVCTQDACEVSHTHRHRFSSRQLTSR